MNLSPATLRASLCGLLLAGTAAAQAGVVDYADVGGFRTFQDTITGNVWVDLDGRFGPPVPGEPATAAISYPTFSAYKAALESAGFTWATSAQVLDLLGTLDFSANAATATTQAQGYAAVMSTLWFSSLELVMGLAENTSTPTGQRRHGLVFSSMPQWGTFASSQDFSAATNSAVGLWAFRAAPSAGPVVPAPVPEPGSLALVGLAMAAMAALVARRQPGRA